MNILEHLDRWLIQPGVHVGHEQNQRHAQMLTVMIVVLLFACAIILPIWMLNEPSFPESKYILLAAFGVLGIAYAFSRTRYYRLGAYILIALPLFVATAVLILDPEPFVRRLLVLQFVAFSVLLASILLSIKETVISSFVCTGYVVAFFFVPDVKFTEVFPYAVNIGTMSAVFVAGAVIRNRYIQNLDQSELRYRSLFEQLNDAVFIMDLNGQYVQVNQRAAHMSGYQSEQLIGMSFQDLLVPEQGTPNENILQCLITGGQCASVYERRIQRQDGTLIPVEVNVEIMNDSAGNPLHIQSIVRDITKRQAAQNLLRRQRDLAVALSAAIDLQESLDLLMDLSFQIEGVDSCGVYLIDTMTGDFKLVFHRGLSSAFAERVSRFAADTPQSRLVSEGQPIHQPYANLLPGTKDEIRQREGLRSLSIIPLQHEGRTIGSINYSSHTHDILPDESIMTLEAISAQAAGAIARIQAETALSESQRDLQTLFDTMSDFVFILDETGCILQTNPVVPQRLGYTADQLTGASVLMLHPPELREAAGKIVQAILQGSATSCPLPLQTSNGMLIPVETKVTQGQWGNRNVLFGISRDVTERERAVARLRENEAKQFELVLEKERVQLLRQFIDRAAHEFRTPLSIISSNAFIMTRLTDPEKRLAKAAIVQDHITQLSRLVSMLLKMTELESGSQPSSSPVDMNLLLDAACQEIGSKYRERTTIRITGLPMLPPVMSNADDLTDAVEQILDNACRFSPAGSIVNLTAGAEAGYMWLEVADTGPGISAEHLPFIFETFWRLDEAHSTPGFGLGLPIARKIIEMYGGTISVESTLGIGTTFRITLPIAGNGRPSGPAYVDAASID